MLPAESMSWTSTVGRFSGDPHWPVLGDPLRVGATNHMRSGNIKRSKPSNNMEWSFVSQLPLAHGVLNVVLSAIKPNVLISA
jgi:hypothetical protein